MGVVTTSGSIGDCGDLHHDFGVFHHKTTPIRALPKFLIETSHITGTIMLLLAASATLSFAMAFTGIPSAISALILGISNDPIMVMLIINILLLVVGLFHGHWTGNLDLHTNLTADCHESWLRSRALRRRNGI